eukprot:1155574-Lingulodinium_polyedra.AAC.1
MGAEAGTVAGLVDPRSPPSLLLARQRNSLAFSYLLAGMGSRCCLVSSCMQGRVDLRSAAGKARIRD